MNWREILMSPTKHRYGKLYDEVSQWWIEFQLEVQTIINKPLTLSEFLFFQLSQILGHSDQLYIRLPPGLRIWQVAMAIIMTVMALWVINFHRCTSLQEKTIKCYYIDIEMYELIYLLTLSAQVYNLDLFERLLASFLKRMFYYDVKSVFSIIIIRHSSFLDTCSLQCTRGSLRTCYRSGCMVWPLYVSTTENHTQRSGYFSYVQSPTNGH